MTIPKSVHDWTRSPGLRLIGRPGDLANRISNGTENRDTGPIEEKSPRAVRSGPSRGYTSGGPVGPTGKSPGATMRLRAVGGGPILP